MTTTESSISFSDLLDKELLFYVGVQAGANISGVTDGAVNFLKGLMGSSTGATVGALFLTQYAVLLASRYAWTKLMH